MEKWPYNTPEWKQWLGDKRAAAACARRATLASDWLPATAPNGRQMAQAAVAPFDRFLALTPVHRADLELQQRVELGRSAKAAGNGRYLREADLGEAKLLVCLGSKQVQRIEL
jgi:hypothetical protein